jgi:hypothetical protein
MPFYDVTEQSTRTTRRHTQKIIDTLRDAFARCTPPSKRTRRFTYRDKMDPAVCWVFMRPGTPP